MRKLMFGFFGEWISYPASILSALAVKKGWIVDMFYFADNLSEDQISERLESTKPDLLALTLMTCDRRRAFKVARLAKEQGIQVIAGGIHASICPDDMIKTGYFDGIVRGDGMGVFAEILDRYKQLDGRVIQGEKHPDISVYSDVYYSETQKQRMIESKQFETMSVLDCPMNCAFCATKVKPFVKIPIETVARKVIEAHRDFGAEDIFFRDDMFPLSVERVRTFRQIIQDNGLDCEYHMHARADHLNDEMLYELKALGVEDLNAGVETTSDRLLKFLNKGLTAEHIYAMADRMSMYGIGLGAHLLFGLPTQDQDDYEKAVEFMHRVKPYRLLTHYYVPLPGTFLFEYCVANGYMPEDWTLNDCLHIPANVVDFKDEKGRTGILKNVDYEMAVHYMKKIMAIHYEQVGSVINDTAVEADTDKWVVFGSGDYFYRVLERLSQRKWKNLLGYYDFTETKQGSRGGYLPQVFPHSIPEYYWREDSVQPKHIVVTKHNGRVFRKVIEPLLRNERRFSGRILSVATLGNQSGVDLTTRRLRHA